MDNRIITPLNTLNNKAPIVAFHGTADPIVAIETAMKHIKILNNNGYKANLNKYEGFKHEIPDFMKKDYIKLTTNTFY